MSNIDKRALREAAEKALPAMKRLLMMPNDELFDEALLNVDGDVEAANAFNLLTGPETVLALLDEIDSLESFRTAFTEFHDKTEWVQGDKRFDVITPWGKHRADALKQYIDHLEGRLEAAEKRIAELEAREVNLPKLSVGEVMHMSGFSRDYAEGWCSGNDNAIHEIHAAGVKVAAAAGKGEAS